MEKCYTGLTDLEAQFKSDYAKFVVERRRWKGDFDRATRHAHDNYTEIEDLLMETTRKSQFNSNIMKMVLDTLMIDQLIQRQDVEDRRKIGLFGQRDARAKLNPALAADYTPPNRKSSPAKD